MAEILSNGTHDPTDGSHAAPKESDGQETFDAVIIGAGLTGISMLIRLRKLNLKVKVVEGGPELGGVWYWNSYPGARVDSEVPFYQLNQPEVYNSWRFSQRFPGYDELRAYIDHIDRTLQIKKDVQFNTVVDNVRYDEQTGLWTTRSGSSFAVKSRYLLLATGLLHKSYTPDFPGLDSYEGQLYHSGSWPKGVNCAGKRVAVIGSGATSVQIVQELAKETANGGSLTAMVRRPSTCLPMGQRTLTVAEQDFWCSYYPTLFKSGRDSHGGFPFAIAGDDLHSISDVELQKLLNSLWNKGGFSFLLGNFVNVMIDPSANRKLYDFWAEKTRSRFKDARKRDIMAPLEPPYPICTKRPPLEHDYYDCLDMDHVDIVSLQETPIKKFTKRGIELSNGEEREFDVIAMATGFDSFTGSLTSLGLHNREGRDLKDIWKTGVRTYMGLFMNGFPNAFLLYSPQAPTAFSNGPTIIECQTDIVAQTIERLEAEHIRSIEPTAEQEDEWKNHITNMISGTLYGVTDSWWNGGNIPGKVSECLAYAAGINTYEKECNSRLEAWKGFVITK